MIPCFRYLLLERNCSINIQNNFRELPFHILLKNYHFTSTGDNIKSIIAMCSEKDINSIINAQDGDGMTLLHLTCKNEGLSMVCYLRSNFQCDVNLLDNNGNLPLHYAVDSYYHHDEMIKLIEMATDDHTPIHAKNSSGITPLHTACKYLNMDVVKYLVFHKKHPLTVSPASNIYNNLDIHLACQNEDDIDLLKLVANHQNVNRMHYLQYVDEKLYNYTCAPIHLACKYNNIPAIKLLSKLKCDFSLKDSQGMLPLHIVCSELRSLECVKLLKICSDDLKAVDKDGNTPLHLACKHNCADVVKYLTMYRCDRNIKNQWKELPLHLACSTTVEIVQRVSRCNTNCQTESGDTPLHIACKAEALDIVKHLVHNCKSKRSMTLKNESGRLPVHYACEHSLEMVKLVAEPCTTQDLTTKVYYANNMTPLDIACSRGLLDIAAYLINEKGCTLSILQSDQSALGYASGILKPRAMSYDDGPPMIETSHLDVVKFLIANCGYDTGKSIGGGYSTAPIFVYVCLTNNLQLLKALTVCSVDIKDSVGNTPLHYACEYSCVEIAQYLIDHGCDQTILNNKGELALHIACCQSLTITRMLTKCDVNTLNLDGNAPIHIACGTEADDIIAYLLKEARCDINIPDENGRYALHIACSRSLKATKFLLPLCDVNCQDANGNTALHIACSEGPYEAITNLLENSLCRADIQNKPGDLPLHNFMKRSSVGSFKLPITITGELRTRELQMIEAILERFSKAAIMANQEGITPTQIAIIKGTTDFLQLLHRRKELDFTNTSNKTLLHIACKYRHMHIVRWLLDHGADSSIPDEGGNYPEHLCIDDNNPELKLKIIQKYRENRFQSPMYTYQSTTADEKVPEHLYIGIDNPSLKTLIELNPHNVHKQNKDGNTILHIACRDDRDHILQHILSKFNYECANALLTINNDGDTPLHILAARKVKLSAEILELIKGHQLPCPNVKNKLGNTPLHVACHNYNTEFATLLSGIFLCDTSIKNDRGETPLHLAVSKSLELVKLVATTENINIQRNDGNTPLHIACLYEKLDVILHLIDSLKCSVQVLNNNEDTPFHILLSNRLGRTTSLMKYIPSSDLDKQNISGDTLLHLACRYSIASTVSFLVKSLQCKTDTISERSGAAPLHFACCRNSINIVKAVSKNCNPEAQLKDVSVLQDKYGVSQDDRFLSGDTPLHVACRAGNVNITQYLLKNGHAGALAICNCQDEMPLHLACHYDDKMIRLFIDYAPTFDCNAMNLSGDTPLHIVCRNKPTAGIIKLLVHKLKCKLNTVNKDGDLPLHIACRHREISKGTLNILCADLSEEELNMQNINGNTVLHELLKHTYEKKRPKNEYYSTLNEKRSIKKRLQNMKETIKNVIKKMSTLAIPNHEGEHPIHLACQYQTLQVVKFLCEQHYSTSEKLPEGILHKACLNDNPSVLEYLIKKFAAELDHHVNIPNKNGDLPLHIAVKQRRIKGVELLIKNTLNINHTNHQGNTPIHELYNDNNFPPLNTNDGLFRSYNYYSAKHASDQDRSQILKCLMEKADVSFSVRNLKGRTPLHCMATRYSDLEVFVTKKKLDADINCQDNEGRTSLHIACQAN